jgi:hypothetical protein
MTISSRDYDAMAAIIASTAASVSSNIKATPESTLYLVAEKLAQYMKAQHQQFNMLRWRSACGYIVGDPVLISKSPARKSRARQAEPAPGPGVSFPEFLKIYEETLLKKETMLKIYEETMKGVERA